MEVRAMDAGSDLPRVLDLFERVFKRTLAADVYRWRLLESPFGAPLVALLWDGAQLVGHCAASPTRSFHDGELRSAQVMTIMTHPNHRNRGLFVRLCSALLAQAEASGVSLVWGLPNTRSHHGFTQRLGWKDVGLVATMTRELDGDLPTANGVTEVDWPPVNTTELFLASSRGRTCPTLRDEGYFHWRYRGHPCNTYSFYAHPGTAPEAFAVVKEHGLRDGRKSLEVVDYLCGDRPEALGSLLASLLAVGAERGCAMVRTWMSLWDVHFPYLEKLGFVPREPLAYFAGGTLGGFSLPESRWSMRHWFITMGDSDNY